MFTFVKETTLSTLHSPPPCKMSSAGSVTLVIYLRVCENRRNAISSSCLRKTSAAHGLQHNMSLDHRYKRQNTT
jgi:hypothetical protein